MLQHVYTHVTSLVYLAKLHSAMSDSRVKNYSNFNLNGCCTSKQKLMLLSLQQLDNLECDSISVIVGILHTQRKTQFRITKDVNFEGVEILYM